MSINNYITDYLYEIKHKETGQFYIGCRWAKNADPSELLNPNHPNGGYFTSSNVVKGIIEREGLNVFEIEYIEEFHPEIVQMNAFKKVYSIVDLEKFELTFTGIIKCKLCLNKCVSGMFPKNITPSEETRKKMSEAQKGKSLSEETKRKISATARRKKIKRKIEAHIRRSERKHSYESRRKMTEALKGEKNPNYVKSLSDETKKKISKTKKKNKIMKRIEFLQLQQVDNTTEIKKLLFYLY